MSDQIIDIDLDKEFQKQLKSYELLHGESEGFSAYLQFRILQELIELNKGIKELTLKNR